MRQREVKRKGERHKKGKKNEIERGKKKWRKA